LALNFVLLDIRLQILDKGKEPVQISQNMIAALYTTPDNLAPHPLSITIQKPDLSPKKVRASSKHWVILILWLPGVYFVEIRVDGQVFVNKFLKI